MKNRTRSAPVFIVIFLISATPGWLRGQGTAFTYQGQLQNGGSPASGLYNFEFSLYNAASGGDQIGGTITNTGVGVTNGLFTTLVDFGSNVFTGATNWLQIGVATNGSNVFMPLMPLQQITPAPYAIFATTASDLSGTLPTAQLTGTIASSNLPASPNFSGTVTANAVTVTNLTIAANALSAGDFTVNGNLSLSPNTPGAGLIYSGTNLLFADYGGNLLAGMYAGSTNITGAFGNSGENVALGDYSLTADVLGYWNTAVGYYAMNGNYFGVQNTGIGAGALQNNTDGGQNTAVGFQALFSTGNASQNTAVGFHALLSAYTGNNTAVGFSALTAASSGSQNTAVGSSALQSTTSGGGNTAVGFNALSQNTGGGDNTAIGEYALSGGTLNSSSVAVGEDALANNTSGGVFNIAVGYGTLGINGGSFNTTMGAGAMSTQASANNNTALGYQALRSSPGDGNIALGYQAGYQLSSGGNNIYIGNQGASSESDIIRLGDPNVHTTTYIAGVITGNGAGLTNLSPPLITGNYTNQVNFSSSGNSFIGSFTGNGAGLTNLPAAQLSGNYPNAVNFTSVSNNFVGAFNGIFTGNGAGLTNITVTATATNLPAGILTNNSSGVVLSGTFTGNGAGLTNVTATATNLPIGIVTNDSTGVVLSGTFSGDGAGLTNLNVSGISNLWQLGGNNVATGQFLGSTNNQPLELWVDGSRAFRLEPNTNLAPNVIGGSPGNFVASGVVGATIAGGGVIYFPGSGIPYTNTITGNFGTIGGGGKNFADGFSSTVGGGINNFAEDSYTTVGGGYFNDAQSYGSTVAGGYNNYAQLNYGTVGGGYSNGIYGVSSTIGGGYGNGIDGNYSTIGGGYGNDIDGNYSTIGGGENNTTTFDYTTVSGGLNNKANTDYATVIGGNGNTASGQYATVVGGNNNTASGDFSFAGGNHASAPYQGDFVWADDNGGSFSATGANQFYVRAGGGVFFYSGTGGTGVQLASGSGSWSSLSDRNAKENFQSVDGQTILAEVAAMPMTTWNYKAQAKSIRHVGPMAQDFHAAFSVGENDTTISTVDEGGVALAAIQGLNQRLEEEAKEKDTEIKDLKQSLAELKKMVEALAEKK